MRKLLLVILPILLLVGCSGSKEIKIGLAITQTYDQVSSDYGIAIRNGYLMAIDEINASGGIDGREIVPVIRDDQNDIEKAKEIVDEFASENINIVVGFSTSKMYPAIQYAQENYDMLFVAATMSSSELTGIDDNLIRITSSDEIQIVGHAEIANETLDLDSMGIIYDADNEKYTKPFISIFSELYKGDILFKDFSKEPDTIISLIHEHNPDGLLYIVPSHTFIKIQQQLSKNDLVLPTLISGWAATPGLFDFGGDVINDVYCIRIFDDTSVDEKYQRFLDDFAFKYNSQVSRPSYITYETMMVIFEALKDQDDISPENLKSRILEISTFDGLQGTFTINEYGDTFRTIHKMQIQNRKFVPID
ncbi:ABC transporter substrate-binding protein [Acidaminobacter sp. JC074]|uniref:ABC transporter substrate-binding protein n=1 Tax=Acidaminobacter sp. JC074 TaxID=2530199 RepID=UPI001F103F6E|nr:ABC transporter substrate-binding protein [Acidaminobacter sp. JC074]